jgi:hypothetical protein
LLNGCHHHTLVAIEVRVEDLVEGRSEREQQQRQGDRRPSEGGAGWLSGGAKRRGLGHPIGYPDGKTTLLFACVYGGSQTISSHHLRRLLVYVRVS